MDLSRIRRGEMIAAAGGIVLLIVLLFVDWYSAGAEVSTPLGNVNVQGDFGAWDGQGFLGTIANLIILAAAAAAIGLALLTATSRAITLPVAASALTTLLGAAAVVMVLLRMLFQPGPNDLIDLRFGIVLALLGTLVVAYGGWESMKEEGTSFDQARDQLRSRHAGGGPPTTPATPGAYPSSSVPPGPPPAPAEPAADVPPPETGPPSEPAPPQAPPGRETELPPGPE
jgi:hypothetical protein